MKNILGAMGFAAAAVLCVSGCGSGSSGTAQNASDTGSGSSVSLDTLRSAPTRVAVGAKTYTLNAYVYRDYMPVVSANGTTPVYPLNASLTVATTDSSAVPAGMTVSSAWVVEGSNVGDFTSLASSISSTTNAVSTLPVPGGSANFAPGATVEVVVKIKAADGTTYLLQNPSVTITAAS